ncbi:WG repeat-containing protein [Taibaiella koreensis]|uniref:WG repeat-containing protein n=1 Tax=Taibaiella koreensis TaxID=1268548 RepID=UPI0013C30D45|nr:WG repeat-containing protein [Taibaiella koreensis]
MKRLLFLLLLSPVLQVYSQQATRLFYFTRPTDSFTLVGVKNSRGKIIIPARYRDFPDHDTHQPIKDSIIFMADGRRSTDETPAASYGDAFDREGKLLYHPMVFDNGPDYFEEGLTRCVEKDKVGFADRRGLVVIQPQWDWASPFSYGYAWACRDCYLDRSRDPEHPDILFRPGSRRIVINKEGKEVQPMEAPASPLDLKTDEGYLPYPFRYTVAEQQLVDSFDRTEVLHKLAFMNYSPRVTGKEARLRFELIEKPPANPGYVVQAYRYKDGVYRAADDMQFFVDARGAWFYNPFFDAPRPFGQWLQQELKASDDYFRTYPDAPNRFDTQLFRKTR